MNIKHHLTPPSYLCLSMLLLTACVPRGAHSVKSYIKQVKGELGIQETALSDEAYVEASLQRLKKGQRL